MSHNLRFYLNLALVGFTVGQAYKAFQRRRMRGRRIRRVWS